MTMDIGTTVVNNKDVKKKRKFPGANTTNAFGPANAPAMGANASKPQGVIATGGYGAAGNVAGGNGAPAGGAGSAGGVMASVSMRRFLCRLAMISHKWLWVLDIMDEPGHYVGLYQCQNCAEISRGAFRDKH